MPLNRPPLALGRGARGVQDARRWVADLCAEIGRPELVGVRPAGGLRAGHQRAAARRAADHGPDARHRRAPPGRGPRLLGRGADPADRAARPARDRRPAAHLRPRAEHRGPLRRRLGRRDRGGRQGRLVRARPPSSPTATACPARSPASTTRRLKAPRPATGCASTSSTSPWPSTSASSTTSASCAARCGCWRSPTSPTTRWPRACPTCSARSTVSCATASASSRSRPRWPRARSRPTWSCTCRGRRPPRWCASSSCSTSPTSSAASRAAALAGPQRRAAEVPGLVPHRVRAPGRRRGPALVARGPVQRPRQRRHLRPVAASARGLLAVALGGALGAVLRWALGDACPTAPGSRGRRSPSTSPAPWLLAAAAGPRRRTPPPGAGRRARAGPAGRLHHAVGVLRADPRAARRRPDRHGRGSTCSAPWPPAWSRSPSAGCTCADAARRVRAEGGDE